MIKVLVIVINGFGANVTAGAIGKFLGYRAGGLVKSKKTNDTDYRKRGMFK